MDMNEKYWEKKWEVKKKHNKKQQQKNKTGRENRELEIDIRGCGVWEAPVSLLVDDDELLWQKQSGWNVNASVPSLTIGNEMVSRSWQIRT